MYFNSAVDEYYHISYTTNRTGLASFERRNPDNYVDIESGAGIGNGSNENLIIKINSGTPLGTKHLLRAWQRESGPIAGGEFYYPLYSDITGGPLNLDGSVGYAGVKLNWQAQINEKNVVTSFILHQQDDVDLHTEFLQGVDTWNVFSNENDLTDIEGIPNLNALNVAQALNSVKYSNFDYSGSILIPSGASSGNHTAFYQQAPLRNKDCQPIKIMMRWGNENTYTSGELDISSAIGIDFRPLTADYKIVNLGSLPKLFGTPGMAKHLNKHASRYENGNYTIGFKNFQSYKPNIDPVLISSPPLYYKYDTSSNKFDDFFFNYSEDYGVEISVERRYKNLRPETLNGAVSEGYQPRDINYEFIELYEVQGNGRSQAPFSYDTLTRNYSNGRVFLKGGGKYKYASHLCEDFKGLRAAVKVPYEVEDTISIQQDDAWVNIIPQDILTAEYLVAENYNFYPGNFSY